MGGPLGVGSKATAMRLLDPAIHQQLVRSAREPATGPAWRLAAILLAVSLVAPPAVAEGGSYLGLTLEQALIRLADGGLPLIFSDRVVAPEMRVASEPTADDPRTILDQLLAPHGLVARPGPGGVLMVVAAGPAAVEGVVRDGRTGRPLSGVAVRLDGGRGTMTAADGSFRIGDLEAGPYRLETERAGYVAAERELRLDAGKVVRLVFDLRPIPVAVERIDVTATPIGILGGGLSALSLGRSRTPALPRLADDPLRQLTLLPGTSGDGVSARFNVRGSHSDEVLVRLDGLEILEPYHLKDLNSALSILAPDAIGEVELLTGGFSVEYGDRMAGVLDLTTREPDGGGEFDFGLSGLQAQASGAGLLRDGRGLWLASLRAGTLALAARLAHEQKDPAFGDVLGKLDLDLRRSGSGGGRTLRVNVLTSRDQLDFQDLVAGEEGSDGESLEQFRTRYDNGYLWLTYQAVLGRELYFETRASYSRVERDRRGNKATSAGELTLEDLRTLGVGGVAVDGHLAVSERQRLKWGAEVRDLDASYDYFNDRELEDPLAAIRDQPRQGVTRFERRFRGHQVAAYLADRIGLSATTSVELGLRFDENSVLDERDLSPRLSLSRALGPDSRLRLAWGIFHQSQRLYELPVEDGETEFFPAERAEHRIVGFEHTFDRPQGGRFRPLSFRAELYERRIRNSRPRFENLFDAISIVPELEADRVRSAPDGGRARGLELFLGGRAGDRIDWFASYAWSRIEDRIDGADVPRSIDQPHTLKLDVDWRTRWRWDFNLGWEAHSGWPTTAISARRVAGEDGVSEIVAVLGPLRGERLPDYHRLDGRASRWWTPGRGRVEVFLQVQNLLGIENVRGFEVEFESREDGAVEVVKEEKSWGGLVPNLGVRWQF
jgi:outer membrane receptor protein involved in Fe transport